MAVPERRGLLHLLPCRYGSGALPATTVLEFLEAAWHDGWRGGIGGVALAERLIRESRGGGRRHAKRAREKALVEHGARSPVPNYKVCVPSNRPQPLVLAVELPSDRFRYELETHGQELVGPHGNAFLRRWLET